MRCTLFTRALFILSLLLLATAAVAWEGTITTPTVILQFGMTEGATEGIDAFLGEVGRPPFPPGDTGTEARFLPNQALADFRPITDSATWTIRFQSQTTATLALAAPGTVLIDGLPPTPLLDLAPGEHTITYEVEECSYQIELTPGWHLVGSPCAGPTTAVLWEFDNGYVRGDHFSPGRGVWINSPGEMLSVIGTTWTATLPTGPGWYIITTTAPMLASAWEYTSRYALVDLVEPGRGYWFKPQQPAGKLLTPPSPPGTITSWGEIKAHRLFQ